LEFKKSFIALSQEFNYFFIFSSDILGKNQKSISLNTPFNVSNLE